MDGIVVVTTVGTEEQANLIGEELVRRRHAACVNIVRVQRSIYRWQGKICSDSEFMLIVKSLESEYSQVESTIRELHNYELPEILAFQTVRGDDRFFSWIRQSLDKDAEFSDGDEPDDEED